MLREAHIPAEAIFAPVGRLTKRFCPVGAATIVGSQHTTSQPRKRRREIRVQNCLTRGAQTRRWNDVYRTGSGRRGRKRGGGIACWIRIVESAIQKAARCCGGAWTSIPGGGGGVPRALPGGWGMST